MNTKELALQLKDKYYNYYCTVYIDFIIEAVELSVKDLKGCCDIDALHKNIKENYI
jgi:hypothetical protein